MGKNGHQSCLPVRVFAIFCDVSRCKRCSAMSRNMYIFFPGGLTYERDGNARRKFWKTLKGDQPGRGPTFFDPWKRPFCYKRSFCYNGLLLIVEVSYWCYRKLMNWVNKTNWLNWRFAQNILSETKIRNLHPWAWRQASPPLSYGSSPSPPRGISNSMFIL